MAAYSEKAEKATDLQLSDAHFHLGFVLDLVDFAADVQRARSLVFAASVTPGEYRDTKRALSRSFNFTQTNLGPANQKNCVHSIALCPKHATWVKLAWTSRSAE